MNSIRRQLAKRLLVAFFVLLGGVVSAVFFSARSELIEQFDIALRAKAAAISTLTVRTTDGMHIDFDERFFHNFASHKPRNFFELWQADGTRIARSKSLGEADLPLLAGTFEHPKFWDLTLPTGRSGRAVGFVFAPKTTGGGQPGSIGLVRLVVATDREDLDEALYGLLTLTGSCAALLIGAVLWLVPRVLRRGLAPLHQLGEQAARIDAHSLAMRLPSADLPAELQPICNRLNDLLSRLEKSFERERRFSADLAHELRTPLAELRSLAECALKWPETRDAATDREILAIGRQMEAIVTHMLALARGEQGQMTVQLESVALAPLIQEVWKVFAAQAAARQLKVDFSLAPATAQSDPTLLRSILNNLFDNAVNYTPPGGEVTIIADAGSEHATLRITNLTDNLEPADVEKIFDRFWRKEAARSDGQHVGLGLSLAKAFSDAMGWTLSAALDQNQRLVFTLVGGVNSPGASK
ncbi:MAG: sensor histidine kinase N-terminal domain-containing protein [Verrucomicrobiota bacterium]|nr:sensor histidine kinase N-terminal domain-containing protein [Verrucomicrobiota bacterium]